MVLVFVVNDNGTFARKLFYRYQLTPPQALGWQANLAELVWGNSFDRLGDFVARNVFDLYFGPPWDDAGCRRHMQARFPDALWVDTAAVLADGDWTGNPMFACLPLRTSPCVWSFPGRDTRLIVAVDPAVGPNVLQCSSDSLRVCHVDSASPGDICVYEHRWGGRGDAEQGPLVSWSASPVLFTIPVKGFARQYFQADVTPGHSTMMGNVPWGSSGLVPGIDETPPAVASKSPTVAWDPKAPWGLTEGTAKSAALTALSKRLIPVAGGAECAPHMYVVVLEAHLSSCSWTDKLAVPLAHGCVVFYRGSPDAHRWFDAGSVIPFTTLEELSVLVAAAGAEDYASRLPAVRNNFYRARAYSCPLDHLVLDGDILSVRGRVTKDPAWMGQDNTALWGVPAPMCNEWSNLCFLSAGTGNYSLRTSKIACNVFDDVTKPHAEAYAQFARRVLSQTMIATALKVLKEWDSLTGGSPSSVLGISLTATKYLALLGRCFVLCNGLPGSVIEIGSGMGGFAVLMASLGTRVYCIELPGVVNLLEAVCTRLDKHRIVCRTADGINDLPNCDILCSEHAWSQCTQDQRNLYAKQVFGKCRHGWLACETMCVDGSSSEVVADTITKHVPATMGPSKCSETFYAWWAPTPVAYAAVTEGAV